MGTKPGDADHQQVGACGGRVALCLAEVTAEDGLFGVWTVSREGVPATGLLAAHRWTSTPLALPVDLPLAELLFGCAVVATGKTAAPGASCAPSWRRWVAKRPMWAWSAISGRQPVLAAPAWQARSCVRGSRCPPETQPGMKEPGRRGVRVIATRAVEVKCL